MTPKLNVVGISEIAEILDTTEGYVSVLKQRGKLPEPEDIVGGRAIWRRSTIERWAIRTNRIDPPQEERTG